MKKKLTFGLLACALTVPAVMGLAACNPNRTHDYTDISYRVINGQAYVQSECHCGSKTVLEKVENAIVVTPQTAQEVLDGDIDGKVIVFDDGQYGHLEIRPTRTTSKVYSYVNGVDTFDKANEITDLSTLSNTGLYHYYREINNVTIAATDDAVITGVFSIESRYINSVTQAPYPEDLGFYEGKERHDYVRGIDLNTDPNETTIGFYSHIQVNNLTFENLDFDGKNGRILHYGTLSDVTIDGLEVNDCDFDTDTEFTYAAVYVKASTSKNVTVKYSEIEGHYQGVYVQNANNLTVKNNEISNTIHNAIACQNGSSAYFTGNILIENNEISKCKDGVDEYELDLAVWTESGERAIRFGVGQDADIAIQNNTLQYCFKEAIYANEGSLTNCSVNITNNKYFLDKMEDLVKSRGVVTGFNIQHD